MKWVPFQEFVVGFSPTNKLCLLGKIPKTLLQKVCDFLEQSPEDLNILATLRNSLRENFS